MKAIRIHSYGHADQMKLEELPPPPIRHDEALVKIRAAGVNPVDWKIREGYLKNIFRASFPLTLGQDFAGDLVAAGKDVQDFAIGDKVFGFASGTYAEYAMLPAKDLVRMPRTKDYMTAASIPTAGLTAYQLIFDAVRAVKDMQILIHGAAGGVGAFAVQLARMKQARVIATASKEDAAYLKGLGAERVIDYRSERFEQQVRDVDVVVDLVGGETLERSYSVLKNGGLLVSTVGGASNAESGERKLRAQYFQMKRDPTQLAHLAYLIDQGTVKTRVSQILPLADAPRALELNERGESRGKIVLQVA